MLCIRSKKVIDYLYTRGCIPAIDTEAAAYYQATQDLYMLLDSYYIKNYCIPNRKEGLEIKKNE